jgi:hypothetical protein
VINALVYAEVSTGFATIEKLRWQNNRDPARRR